MKKIIYLLLITTILAFANEKPTLTVYTYNSFAASWGPAPKIKKAFETKDPKLTSDNGKITQIINHKKLYDSMTFWMGA